MRWRNCPAQKTSAQIWRQKGPWETEHEILSDRRNYRRWTFEQLHRGAELRPPYSPGTPKLSGSRASACAAGRLTRGSEVVRDFQRRTAAGADAYRAGAKLRSARCRGARRAGSRESRHNPFQSIPAGERQWRYSIHPAFARWSFPATRWVCAEPESQLGGGIAQSAVL